MTSSATLSTKRPLVIVLTISGIILLAELLGAWLSGSLALMADAGHMLTDVAGLSLAVWAASLNTKPATQQRTWGYKRAEVLAAATQAAVLLAVGVFILVEAVLRLITPPVVVSGIMLAFGIVGLLGNMASIAFLSRIHHENLNTKAARLEVINDMFGAGAVLMAAIIIFLSGWTRADGVASLLVGFLILPRTWKLLRGAVDVLLESTPRGIDLQEVKNHILAVEHVVGLHDVHASLVATDLPVVSAHVVVEDECFKEDNLPALLDKLQTCLSGCFDVAHSTFQFERASHAEHENPPC